MPTAYRPCSTSAHVCGSFSASQTSLVPEKYGSSRSPVSSATRSSWPASRSRVQMSAVRRSCHTIARRGEPRVSRSQSRIVSRWLVMPTACQLGGVVRLQRGAGRLERGLPDLLGGVLDPARLREVLGELLVAAGRDPAVLGDDDRGHAGGAGVDGEDAHRSVTPRRGRSRRSSRRPSQVADTRISRFSAPTQRWKSPGPALRANSSSSARELRRRPAPGRPRRAAVRYTR